MTYKKESTCTSLLRKATNKVSEMSGLSKLFKFTSSSSQSASKAPATTVTATSSINPHCAWVSRQKYLRARRLVTRTDVRARMSVWARLFNWCRKGKISQPENETMFTVHP